MKSSIIYSIKYRNGIKGSKTNTDFKIEREDRKSQHKIKIELHIEFLFTKDTYFLRFVEVNTASS